MVARLSDDLYRTLMEVSPICTVDVIFLDAKKNRTLLGRRTSAPYRDAFFSFGGRLHKNEEFVEAALRIARSETGILLKAEDMVFAGILNEIAPDSKFEGINYHAVDVYFGVQVDHETFELDFQHSDAAWVAVDDPSLHPNVRFKVQKAIEALQ